MKLVRDSKNKKLATIYPGPLCNLACATCNDGSSTRWQSITGRKPVKLDTSITVNDLDWRGIESVVVCGGEPILHASIPSIIEYTAKHGIYLVLHFNGTVRPNTGILDLVQQHSPGKVMFRISIDGINEQFDYLRWPGKWNKFVSNVFWMRNNAPDNVKFSFNFTQSVLNSERFTQVTDWVNNEFTKNTNFGKIPCDKQIARAFNNPTSLAYFDRLDQQRNTSWKATFPETANKYKDFIT